MTITYVESSKLPTPWGIFVMHGFCDDENLKEHVVLTMGDLGGDEPLLARIHSECLTGDALFSLRCDCGPQLQAAMHKVALAGRGVIFYLRQEGRGIGLGPKIQAYKLQEQGYDTVEANLKLGFGAELRDYGVGAQILHDLGVRKMRFMTNNPKKVIGLEGYGLKIVEMVPLKSAPNKHNAKYLETKRIKMGHLL